MAVDNHFALMKSMQTTLREAGYGSILLAEKQLDQMIWKKGQDDEEVKKLKKRLDFQWNSLETRGRRHK